MLVEYAASSQLRFQMRERPRELHEREVVHFARAYSIAMGRLPVLSVSLQLGGWCDFEQYLVGTKVPMQQFETEFARQTAHRGGNGVLRPVVDPSGHFLLSRLRACRQSRDDCLAKLRVAQIILAKQRFGVDQSANKLGLSPEVFVDPYTGESLKIVLRKDQLSVYSVGPNYHDDGGPGAADSNPNSDDIGCLPIRISPESR